MELNLNKLNQNLPNMSVEKEFIKTLFDPTTFNKAKDLDVFNRTISFDSFGMNFRLFSTKSDLVTLELFSRDDRGTYWKIIGFYDQKTEKPEITILKEFEELTSQMISNNELQSQNYNTLSTRKNAYLGGCSKQATDIVREMFKNNDVKPKTIYSNGLELVAFKSMMNSIEINVNDDNVDIEDLYLMFRFSDDISIHCAETDFIELMNDELIGVFRN